MRVFSRNVVLLGGLLATAIAVPALAQQAATPTKYYECPANFQATPNEQEAAHGAFLAGKAAYDEADYQKAIDYFKDAYKRDCTKHALLNFIARAYEAKGDRPEAINALETYIARAPKADDADQVRKRIDNLKAQVASQPTNSGTSVPTSSATTTPTVTASASDTSTAPPPTGGHTIPPWIVVGAGGAAAITGVILLIIGTGKVSDSHNLALNGCPKNACPTTYTAAQIDAAQALNKSGYTFDTLGIVVGGIGVAAIVGGLVWHFIEPTGLKTEPKASLVPIMAPGYGGASFAYKF